MAEHSFNPKPINPASNNNTKNRNQNYNYNTQRNSNFHYRNNQRTDYNNYRQRNNYNYNNNQQHDDESRFHYRPSESNDQTKTPQQDENINNSPSTQQPPQTTPSSQQQSQTAPAPQQQSQTSPPPQQQPQFEPPPQQQPQFEPLPQQKPQAESPPQQQSQSTTSPQQQPQTTSQSQQQQQVPAPPPNLKQNAFNFQNRRGAYNRTQSDDRHQNFNRNQHPYKNYNNNNNNNYNNSYNNRNNDNYNNRNNRSNRTQYARRYNSNNGYNNNSNNNRYSNNNGYNNPNNNQTNQPPQQYNTRDQQIENLKKTFCIMSDEVNSSLPNETIANIENIGIDLLEKPPFDNQLRSDPTNLMNAPMNLVDLLIEGLAINQPEELRFLANKTFPTSKTLILNLPVPMPISFVTPTEPAKTQLGFYDTNISDAQESQNLTMAVLNTMACRQKIVYSILNVAKNSFTNEELGMFTNECGVVVLKDDIAINGNYISFTLHVLQYDYSQDKHNKVEAFVNRMYQAGQNPNSQISSDEQQVYLF